LKTPEISREVKGPPLTSATKGAIFIHGRGGSARDIIGLYDHLGIESIHAIAPEAEGKAWYPHSFMAPLEQNQPAFDRAMKTVQDGIRYFNEQGMSTDRLFLIGFSQGACVALEYAARNAQTYAGIIAFTGGLIGMEIARDVHSGDFNGTPVLITNGTHDPHVPLQRTMDSALAMQKNGAIVKHEVYAGRPHTILQAELELARLMIDGNLEGFKGSESG